MESMDGFTEAYDTRTGLKHRVPPEWVGDPIVGRFLKKTPSQRRLDGELGQLPTQDSTIPEIRDFAEIAEIDLAGLSKKDELLSAVLAAAGDDADLPTEPDPNAPVNPDLDNPDPDADPASDHTPA